MKTERIKKRLINYLGLGAVFLMFLVMFGLTAFSASKDVSYVVFTANWCANCREIIPIAQSVSASQGVPITLIDVDASNAPKQAKQFKLTIPTRDLPQIYLKTQSGAQLIFDGSHYSYGQTDEVRTLLMNQIK